MPNVIAIVQARMGSERLPGKSLMDVAGKPLLQHVIERLGRAKWIQEVVVATTEDERDKAILELCTSIDVRGYMGSGPDVLNRYAMVARATEAKVVMRVTGDCPLTDPAVADTVVEAFLAGPYDYVSNVMERTYPLGADAEVFTADALYRAEQEARKAYEREHVTPYFYENDDLFRLGSVAAEEALQRPQYRICVDTQDDLDLVRAVYDRLGPSNAFSLGDVVALLDAEPELVALNAHVRQKQLGE